MVSPRGLLAILTICAVLPLAACGSNADTGAEPGTSPAPSAPTEPEQPPAPPEDPDADPGEIFTADPTIVGAHPIPVTSWTRVAEDRIAVHFESGVPACYGVDASVTETDTAVTVELRSGTRADATDKMCVMMAVFGTLEIPLKSPLGNRQVLSAV